MRVASVIKEFFVSWEHQKVNSGISAAIDVRIEEGIYGGRDLPGGGWLKQFSQKREGAMRSRQRLHYEHPQYLEEHGTSWEELPEQVVHKAFLSSPCFASTLHTLTSAPTPLTKCSLRGYQRSPFFSSLTTTPALTWWVPPPIRVLSTDIAPY